MSSITESKKVSFPITVWYSEKACLIYLSRATDESFDTTISVDPNIARGHVHLHRQLAEALHQGGSATPPVGLQVKRD